MFKETEIISLIFSSIGVMVVMLIIAAVINTKLFRFSAGFKNLFQKPVLLSFISPAVSGAVYLFYKCAMHDVSYNYKDVVHSVAIVCLLADLFLLAVTVWILVYACAVLKKEPSEITASDLPWYIAAYIAPKDAQKPEKKKDERSFIKRFALVLVPMLALSLMYLFLGVFEVFFSNIEEWLFSFGDFFSATVIIFAVIILICLLIAAVLRGGKLDGFVVIASSAAILSYIQNLFLNTNTFLTGATPKTPVWALVASAVVWSAGLYFPFFAYVKRGNKNIVRVLTAAAGLIAVMQLFPIPFVLSDGLQAQKPNAKEYEDFRLDGKDQHTVSSDENIMVFIMDSFSSGDMNEILERYPEYNTLLSDFIFFDNVNSETCSTAISLPVIMTCTDIDFSISLLDSHKKAWSGENAEYFYNSVHDAGYTVRFYTDGDKYAGGAENMIGKIDNAESFTVHISTDPLPTALALTRISAYKYLPYIFKPLVYLPESKDVNRYTVADYDDGDFTSWYDITDTSVSRGIDMYNDDYFNGIKNRTKYSDGKTLVFNHSFGMHEPFSTIGNIPNATKEDAEKSCMDILTAYIDVLKENGSYDNSTIILTADHGTESLIKRDHDSVMLIKLPHYTSDKLERNSAPGNIQTDLLPTILDIIGIEHERLGPSLFDLDENMTRERRFRNLCREDIFPSIPRCTAFGESIHNGYYEYVFTGRSSEIHEYSPRKFYRMYNYWW